MKKDLRLAIAQVNCTVGDFEGNCRKIMDYIRKAERMGVDIISFPELAVTGYPPEDLLMKEKFVDDNLETLKRIARCVGDLIAVVGFVARKKRTLYNAAAVIYEGKVKGVYHKMILPNYGVFDERRYFAPGSTPAVFRSRGYAFGVNICEDIWHDDGPVRAQAASGARLIININASPYYAGRIREREAIIRNQARKNRVSISYANLVGGQDELVFDGQSMIVDKSGRVAARAEPFKEDLLIADLAIPGSKLKGDRPRLPRRKAKPLEPTAEIYQALLLGLKDYVDKNGFKKVVVGLSGGIDSSLVAALAADALGKENVVGVFLPTRYTSSESESDAKGLASNLGIRYISISIDKIFELYLMTLEPQFSGLGRDITEENLQARIRGNVLMALSNKFGWLVLATGNKSEMSTGYATLYGDMAGGLAVIKDVPKTLVYKLARHRNSSASVIPEGVFQKAPTAELKPDQKDSDTLPPYETLDPILKAYVEEDKRLRNIISMGFDKEAVYKALDMVDKTEYKRRQSPPGIKITPKAFGKDRRMPITNKYKIAS